MRNKNESPCWSANEQTNQKKIVFFCQKEKISNKCQKICNSITCTINNSIKSIRNNLPVCLRLRAFFGEYAILGRQKSKFIVADFNASGNVSQTVFWDKSQQRNIRYPLKQFMADCGAKFEKFFSYKVKKNCIKYQNEMRETFCLWFLSQNQDFHFKVLWSDKNGRLWTQSRIVKISGFDRVATLVISKKRDIKAQLK